MKCKSHHHEIEPIVNKEGTPRAEKVLMNSRATVRLVEKALDQITWVAVERRGEHHRFEPKNGINRNREIKPTTKKERWR